MFELGPISLMGPLLFYLAVLVFMGIIVWRLMRAFERVADAVAEIASKYGRGSA